MIQLRQYYSSPLYGHNLVFKERPIVLSVILASINESLFIVLGLSASTTEYPLNRLDLFQNYGYNEYINVASKLTDKLMLWA